MVIVDGKTLTKSKGFLTVDMNKIMNDSLYEYNKMLERSGLNILKKYSDVY
jgi:hypothetical protein